MAWMVAVCVVVLHRVYRRRKGKDLRKIPLAPGSFPGLGHIKLVQVCSCKWSRAALRTATMVYRCRARDRSLVWSHGDAENRLKREKRQQ